MHTYKTLNTYQISVNLFIKLVKKKFNKHAEYADFDYTILIILVFKFI